MRKFINRRVRYPGSLAVNIIARNEEENIGRAIRSIKDLADQIIVIDTGSKDGTMGKAIIEGAIVKQLEWSDDFSIPRNEALKMSETDWILSIDADEMIPKKGKRDLTEMIKRPEIAAYRMETWTYHKEQRMLDIQVNRNVYEEGKGYKYYIKSIKSRLFQKRKGVVWEFPIHEVVDPSIARLGGKFEQARVAIQHLHGEMSPAATQKKTDLYLRLAEKKVRQYPTMGHAWGELAVCELSKRLYFRAARSYYNAIRFGEDIPRNRYGYAGVLKILGHPEKGDREIDRAICMDFTNLTTIN